MLDVEVADVGVRLADADEDDRLPRRVHERERGAHLVVDRVELRQHDPVDQPPRARHRDLRGAGDAAILDVDPDAQPARPGHE